VAAVADALGLPAHAVRIVAGATNRTKTLAVEGADAAAVQQLLDTGSVCRCALGKPACGRLWSQNQV
jgi:hypothetical protein